MAAKVIPRRYYRLTSDGRKELKVSEEDLNNCICCGTCFIIRKYKRVCCKFCYNFAEFWELI
jgi:hypothetical protein